MPQAPPVLQRLIALGLTQTKVAEYIGATQAAVSLWLKGKRPFRDPWRTEANVLLAVLHEYLAHGDTLDTFTYRPTMVMNPGGITQMSSPLDFSREDFEMLSTVREAASALPPGQKIAVDGLALAAIETAHLAKLLSYVVEQLTQDPVAGQPTAYGLDTLRRSAESIRLTLLWALDEKARAALEETSDVDQAP